MITAEIVLLFSHDKPRLYKSLVAWLSAPVVIAPIIITTEIGGRLFLTSNIFLIIFALLLLDALLSGLSKKAHQITVLFSVIAAIAVAANYVNVYFQIGQCKDQRNLIMTEAVETGANTVTLPGFPYEEYLWGPNPHGDLKYGFFKAFYGFSPDAEIIFQE